MIDYGPTDLASKDEVNNYMQQEVGIAYTYACHVGKEGVILVDKPTETAPLNTKLCDEFSM